MANTWPEDLPQTPYKDGSPSGEPAIDNTIRTSVTAGPAKLRRRFTAVPTTVKLDNIWMTTEQVNVLDAFIANTLKEVNPFQWIDFKTGLPAMYRFPNGSKSVKWSHDAGDVWLISLELEKLP